jgi:ATP-dependent protease ClpP protease subunit
MATAADLRDLEAEKLRAEIAMLKAARVRHLAEAAFRKLEAEDLKKEMADAAVSVEEQRIYEFTQSFTESSVNKCITTLSEWRAKSKDPITIRITSSGGSVIDGLAMYDYIKALQSEGIVVDTVALGWAASMGGVLLQAGTTRYFAPNASMLIHEVSTMGRGKTSEMEDELAFTKVLQDRLVEILTERSNLTPAQLRRKWARKDWWLGSHEVLELGFADKLWPDHSRPKKAGKVRQ